MKIKIYHWIGIVIGLIIIGVSFLFMDSNFFLLIMGIGVIIGILPFIVSVIRETIIENEKEERFLEFARNLVESVKTGTPISKSIINNKSKPYGVLSPNVRKLGNQISLGIPLNTALETFSKDVDNKMISRTLSLIGQAEKAGGDIGEILESVAGAVTVSDKLKKERKAAISTLVVQGYIIFVVFIAIILIMQFQILPMLSGIGDLDTSTGSEAPGVSGVGGIGGFGGDEIDLDSISRSFLYLLLIQGLFSGLAIGMLSENNLKAGIKHSFALMIMSFLISAGANVIFG